ncbi:saccharopine dehydrogenase NADP-binding domain-containing protein [Microbulbifer marinus]|uniref:Saccharopine dehydrogenase NADP binding domain-containing protein n=1 Tax=Microbulbifer marinus TaxID=658218 RepID=A0A1H3VVT5_9GAMM|nr:saccharopine dehydrogenase NADP-binding domain-containing protein [Microbulbifer marinus]SDZ78314.1 Saccharopine dehydrogenase NADP binding domain-containing protein [Microbulbifer marinus]
MVKNYKKRVLILGGYGNFGARIARMLSSESDVQLIIAGHDRLKAELCASKLPGIAEGLRLERDSVNLSSQLKTLHLDLLIHCAGPFQQQQDYRVAQACIQSGTPYIDIADARRYVCDFQRLSPAAETAGIAMVSGASSLPALSSAVLAEIQRELPTIHSVDIAIAPAHRIVRGLATVRSGFEALGQSFPLLQNGEWRESYAGNYLRGVKLAHPVGERWLCDFDVPDLELCPRELPHLHSARFATGLQPRTLQTGLAVCARLARMHLPTANQRVARLGHKLAAHWPGGSRHGGMLVRADGLDQRGNAGSFQWQILGLNGDGPWIPAAPAAALARKFLRDDWTFSGAQACWQLLTVDEILAELAPYSIVTAMERLESPAPMVPAPVSNP